MALRPDDAEIHLARADAGGGLHPELLHRLADRQRRENGALRIVLVGHRRPKIGEQAVAQEPVDPPVVLHHRVDHGGEDTVDEVGGVFGGQVGRAFDRPAQVGEQHGQEARLARRLGQELISERARQRPVEGDEL